MKNQTNSGDQNTPEVIPVQVRETPKSNKFLVILLYVLLLLSISTSIFFVLKIQKLSKQLMQLQIQVQSIPVPTTDSTKDWKIYENTQLGYQISYPSNYFIKVESLNNVPSIKISNNPDFEKDEFALIITIELLDDNNNFNPSSDTRIFEVLNRIGYQELSNKWGNYISGNFLGDPPWGYYQVVFPSMSINKPSILITSRIHGSDEITEIEGGTENIISMNVQQILSTFKFLNNTNSTIDDNNN